MSPAWIGHEEMSDDAGEEYDALDILQEFTDASLTWQFVDGDLLLLEHTEMEA